jgi:hypothetical protein
VRKTLFILGCLATVVFTGCTGESNRPEATGEGRIRAINAIKTSPIMTFLIEERRIGTVAFKSSSNPVTFDDLEYIFNVETILAGDLLATRVASQPLDVIKDTDYTFLISGALEAPDITVWETPIREWTVDETVFEVRIANTADSIGDVDVYFAPPGTPLMPGNALGTLSFGEVLPAADFESGQYVMTFTAAGDPLTVHFESSTFSLVPQTSPLLSIFDTDPNDTGLWSVRAFFAFANSALISAVDSTATARFYHASTELATADIYNDETLMAEPIVIDHEFRDFTPDIDMPFGVNPLFYTAAGNSGAPLFDGEALILATTHKNVYAVGILDELRTVEYVPDRRPVETLAKFTFMNTSLEHPVVDLYIVPTGIDIANVFPSFFAVSVGDQPGFTTLPARSFEMYLTPVAEKTVITGPIALDTMLGDVFEYVAYDNVLDPMTADLVSIPLP